MSLFLKVPLCLDWFHMESFTIHFTLIRGDVDSRRVIQVRLRLSGY